MQASKKKGSEKESPEQRAPNKLKKKQEKEGSNGSNMAVEPRVQRKRDAVADSACTLARPLKRSNQSQEPTGRSEKRKAEEVVAGSEAKRTRTQVSLGCAVISFRPDSACQSLLALMFFYIRVICILMYF